METDMKTQHRSLVLTHRLTRTIALGFAGLALLSFNSHAAIVNTGGTAVQIPAPPSVEPGAAFPNPANIHAFNERQCRTLPADMPYDIAPVSDVTDASQLLTSAVIPRNSKVSSHYIQYEPAVYTVAQGTVLFDAPIIGVVVTQANLDATNGLGRPVTTYPNAAQCAVFGAGVDCGLELPPDMIHVDNMWVRVNFDALSPGDRVRVITQCP